MNFKIKYSWDEGDKHGVRDLGSLLYGKCESSGYDVPIFEANDRGLNRTWEFIAQLMEILVEKNILTDQDLTLLFYGHHGIRSVERIEEKK